MFPNYAVSFFNSQHKSTKQPGRARLRLRRFTDISSDHPELGAEYEKHKDDQLKKQKEGRGHWKAELASNSEEAVAADRSDHSDHSEKGIKDLQDKTAKHAEEKHK